MNCGGFRYDDTTLQLTDGVLSAIGGAGGGITQAQADARYLLKDNGDATGTTTMFSLVVQEEVSSASVVSDSGTFKDATVSNVLTIPATGMVECHGNFAAYGPAYFVAGVDCSGLQITNVGDPKSNLDAANKKYVDDAVAGAASPVGYLKADGTVPMTGNLVMGLHKITGLAEPTSDGDAATYQYVNDLLADENANTTNNYLNLSGAVSMRGDLKMGTHKVTGLGAPTLDTDGATKKYVDDAIAGVPTPSLDDYLKINGTTAMAGNLDMSGHNIEHVAVIANTGSTVGITVNNDLVMNSNKITGLAAPSANTDATTKQYVDTGLAVKQDAITGTNGQVVMIDSTGKATAQDYTPPIPSFPYITQSVPASGWVQDGDVYKYTWNNSKILSETTQLVIVSTPSPSLSAWKANKIECISQSAGTLILSAATAPTASITAIAVLIPVTSST